MRYKRRDLNTSLIAKNLINGTNKDLREQSFTITGIIEEEDSAAVIIDISNSSK